MSFPILTTAVAVPLVGAVVTAAAPRLGVASAAAIKQLGLLFSGIALVLGVVMAAQYETDGGLQFTETHTWIEALGVHYALGVDGLSLLMVLLTVVLVPIVLLASWHDADHIAEREGDSLGTTATFVAWALALEGLSLAVFAASDVFLFYVVFEATLIPAYFLIGSFGHGDRGFAALKFLMYQLGGGLVLLAGVIGLYVVSAQNGTPSYLVSDLANLPIDREAGRWLFVAFFIAFAVKAPLFPVHTWLADTTQRATPGTSVLLVCVLDKIGTYGMLRFCLGLFPEASQWATPVVVTLALISIVYGALLAIGQDDVLRLIGLTSLSHFGFITLGIFAFSSQGQSGAILYMVNHGIGTAALFIVAGYLIRRRGTTLISEMGGFEKATPVLAGVLLVAGLATLSLPGLSPFISELLVIIAAFDQHWWVGAVAVSGIVLAAIYVLWAYQRIMTGPPREDAGEVRDLGVREIAAVVPLVALLIGLGFYPRPLFEASNPYVSDLMQHVGVTDDAPSVDPAIYEAGHDQAEENN
ncbi:NADH-quinone oxidoreductase subunit M [Nocardioides fonticola]|uniref:NADH-quinone oxidoreductase subunit M n=1 Tax=Nocardioides fonticola TaxID=450363 RepID=A0ABP7XEF4_9ACTN